MKKTWEIRFFEEFLNLGFDKGKPRNSIISENAIEGYFEESFTNWKKN